MSKLKNTFNAALEQAFIPDIPGVSDQAVTVVAAGTEIDAIELFHDTEEAVRVGDKLQDLCVSMLGLLENVDCLKGSPMAYSLATETLKNNVGIDTEHLLPSEDCFSDESRQDPAVRVSMESITKKIADIWKAILKAIKNISKRTSEFFKKVLLGFRSIKGKVETLRKSVLDIDGAAKKETVSVVSLGLLRYKGKLDNKSIKKGMVELTKDSRFLYDGYFKTTVEFFRDLSKAASKYDFAEGSGFWKEPYKSINNKGFTLSNKEVIGSKIFKLTAGSVDGNSQWTYPNLENVPGNRTEEPKGDLDVLSKADMIAILGDISELIELSLANEGFERIVDKEIENSSKEIDSLLKRLSKEKDKVSNQAFKAAFPMLQKDLLKPIKSINLHGFRVSRAVLRYVESSFNAY